MDNNLSNASGSPGGTPSADNSLAVVMHLLGFAGFVFPFGNMLGPLVL
jgi:uncharacterized Tic20 family protein